MHSDLVRTALLAALISTLPAVCARGESAEFKSEPDKSMAAAHESFVKGNLDKAAMGLRTWAGNSDA